MRSLRPLALLLVAAALGAAGAARPASPAQAAGVLPSAAALRICSGCSSFGLDNAGRYRYLVLHAWQSTLIPRLKAATPGLKVLVYKDMAATVDYTCSNGKDDADLPTGVGYCASGSQHPEWFLKDTTGARIAWCDFPHDWQMDVGDATYARQWAQEVVASAKRGGFDGVMIDDANDTEAPHLCGRTIAKYPTQADYSAATTRFLSIVAPEIRNQGLLALPNIALADWWKPSGAALWDQWVSFSSGAVQEYYSKWTHASSGWFTDDGQWHNDWSLRQQYVSRTESAGKIFIGITYAPSGDVRSMRYARASFLMDWDGGASALAFEPTTPEAQDPYAPDWSVDVGNPAGARFEVGVAWRRDYTGGTVLVNPSPSTAQTVALGAPYALPDGTTVTSVTLAPTTALVLSSSLQKRTLAASSAATSGLSRLVAARGAIAGRGTGLRWFAVRSMPHGLRLSFVDAHARLRFRSDLITRARVEGRTVVLAGRGRADSRRVWFAARVHDGGSRRTSDGFRIQLSTGYLTAARLARGNVTIR